MAGTLAQRGLLCESGPVPILPTSMKYAFRGVSSFRGTGKDAALLRGHTMAALTTAPTHVSVPSVPSFLLTTGKVVASRLREVPALYRPQNQQDLALPPPP